MPDANRRQSKSGTASRDSIVAAAVRILDDPEKSFDARTVAKEAGKSLGTLSFHFREGGLRELRAEAAQIGFMRLLADLSDVLLVATDPIDGLRRLGRAYVNFAIHNRRLYGLMYGEPWGDKVEPVRSEVQAIIREHVLMCQDAKLVRRDAPEKLARIGWALMHGVVVLHLNGLVPVEELDALVDDAFEVLVEGLAT